ncbi:VanZ family protein [Tenacibaculum halocynthiae]|uniref:VanZ family protein n=1 Tax=Tenacibaculum halocynthiae TaxID=1254437 RepID=UPI00389587E5
MLIKNLFKDKKNRIIIAIFITISIAILSLIKLGKQPISISNIDKIEHSIAYFFLTFSWLLALVKTKYQIYIVSICCLIYGIIIEALQATITIYRTGDYYDVIANSVGVLLAFILFSVFFYKKDTIW